jgi:23S rRNA (cytosine1962-C5)-methyltransferase
MGAFSAPHEIIQADVLQLLEKDSLQTYDFVILDPPAFAKKRRDVESALAAYRRINQAVFAKCKKSTLLLTCSCSYFIDAASFQHVIFQAAAAAQREVKILLRHIQALDHPTSLFHPEGEYLKSLLLWIE